MLDPATINAAMQHMQGGGMGGMGGYPGMGGFGGMGGYPGMGGFGGMNMGQQQQQGDPK